MPADSRTARMTVDSSILGFRGAGRWIASSMMRISRMRVISAAVIAGTLLAAVARAQPERVRTLTYDAERKEWFERPPPPPGTPEGDLHVIRQMTREGRYAEALKLMKRFSKTHGAGHELQPDLLLAQAEAMIGAGDYDEAHEILRGFLAEYSGIAQTSEALRMEFIIAEAYLSGAKRKLWGMRILSGEDTALRILDELSTDHPESRVAEFAVKKKADYYFDTGQHRLAEDEYARLLRDYPRSQYYRFAWRRSAEAALASFGGVEYDEAALIEAEERYREYDSRFPTEAAHEDVDLILDRIHELRGEKEYSIGDYYERTAHLSSAVYHYRAVREHYPDTIAARKATQRLELLGVLVAEEEVPPPVGG
jgi:outer membrane protein assembly factor BamD (BamD/ComL family)